MPRKSAGIVLYRCLGEALEVMLVHPGGPFWKNKDLGAWSIPKGEIDESEEPTLAAKREFREETGQPLPEGKLMPLKPVRQNASKTVFAWAVEGNLDVTKVESNYFKMEFPPASGKWIEVPEVDKAGWFDYETAKQKIIPGQRALLDELAALLQTRQNPQTD